MTGAETTRRYLHPEGGMVFPCPECDYAPVTERVGRGNASTGDGDARFVCYRCSHTWDHEPTERPAHHVAGGGSEPGTRTALADLTADDVDALSDLGERGSP